MGPSNAGIGGSSEACLIDRNACQKAGAATAVVADCVFPPGAAFILATLGPGFGFAVVDDPTHAAWTATCELLDASMTSQGTTVVAVGASNATLPWVPRSNAGGGGVSIGQDVSGYTLRLTVSAAGTTAPAVATGGPLPSPISGLNTKGMTLAMQDSTLFLPFFTAPVVADDLVTQFNATVDAIAGTTPITNYVTASIIGGAFVITAVNTGVTFMLSGGAVGNDATGPLGLASATYGPVANTPPSANTITGAPRVVLGAGYIVLPA